MFALAASFVSLFAVSSALAAAAPALIRFDYQKGEITTLCAAAIKKAEGEISEIKNRSSLSQMLLSHSLGAFETALADLSDTTSPLTFMAEVSRDSHLRDEGSACEEKVGQFFPTLFVDKKLYQALKRAIPFGAAEKRLASETLRAFEKNGMNLSDEKLVHLKELKQKLASLQAKFSLNLNNDTSSVTFTKADLEGVSENFLSRLKRSGPGYIVTTKSTDFIQVMENAVKGATRKKISLVYLNHGGPENTKLMEEAIALRSEIATLLGYPTWADVQIDGRMAKTSDTVLKFLNGLKEKLTLRNRQDIEKLYAYKKERDPKAGPVESFDVAFLETQLKKKAYTLDEEKIAEYFPADYVMNGLFDVYSTLFGVNFVEVKDVTTWADGVKLYEIRDSLSGVLRAYFYKDTIPREGKYGHAAAFTLTEGRKLSDGKYATPVSSIVANFTPPSGKRPSLLTHEEVETLFHEFGHVMHQTLTMAPYASLAGSSVAQDFVEAPSQMLENWVWNKEILRKISKHFESGEPLPEKLIDQMIAAKDFNQGYAYMRQLLFALFDMKIHASKGPVDVTAVYNQMYQELFGMTVIEGSHFPAGFGHLMGGYDAGYYGYLWSEVYAQDMFSRFQKDGLLNPKTGAEYRKAILEQGNMRDAIDLLRTFLGREPNTEAFYRKLGI